MPHWGDVKMTALAVAAGSRLIKTHPAIQLVTSCAWRGTLNSGTTWPQVLTCIFFPPMVFVRKFIRFNYSKDITLGDPESIMLVAITVKGINFFYLEIKIEKFPFGRLFFSQSSISKLLN